MFPERLEEAKIVEGNFIRVVHRTLFAPLVFEARGVPGIVRMETTPDGELRFESLFDSFPVLSKCKQSMNVLDVLSCVKSHFTYRTNPSMVSWLAYWLFLGTRFRRRYHMCLHNQINHLIHDHSTSPTVAQQAESPDEVCPRGFGVVAGREDQGHFSISLHRTAKFGRPVHGLCHRIQEFHFCYQWKAVACLACRWAFCSVELNTSQTGMTFLTFFSHRFQLWRELNFGTVSHV